MDKKEIEQMHGMLNYYSGIANKPQHFGSDMYNEEVDTVKLVPSSLTEIGKDEAENPIMTSPVALEQFGAAQVQEEKSGLANAAAWLSKTGKDISQSDLLSGAETIARRANPFSNFGYYLADPSRAKEGIKDFIHNGLDNTTRINLEHSALYESFIYNPGQKVEEINRLSKILGFNVSPYADNREVWKKLALAADQVERLGKLHEYQGTDGKPDIDKVYAAFPWLAQLQKSQGTAAASMVLANIDGVKTISDVYKDNEIYKLFGSGWTGLRRSVNTVEKSARLLPSLLGRRLPTKEEQKKIAEIDAILNSLPNYSYDSALGILGGLTGNVAEQLNLLATSVGARAAVLKALASASAKTQNRYATLLSTILISYSYRRLQFRVFK